MSTSSELMLVGLYYFPFIVALLRRHPNENGIFLLNTFIGWTVIGWFAALIMACGNVSKQGV